MRVKKSITLDSELVDRLKREAEERNLSFSRLVENKLKGIDNALREIADLRQCLAQEVKE